MDQIARGFSSIASFERQIFSHRDDAMPVKPPITELEFIQKVRNHREFSSKIGLLCSDDAATLVESYAAYVAWRWAKLGVSHLEEAKKAKAAKMTRAVYSRSYYACYNLSKAVRFLSEGSVSLKGDDHQKAPDLPNDFPDRDKVSRGITDLYQCRLIADYDNWTGYGKKTYSLSVTDAIKFSNYFKQLVRSVLRQQYGISI